MTNPTNVISGRLHPHLIGQLALYELAEIIHSDWGAQGKTGVNYAAKPYLEAMLDLESVDSRYGLDSGDSIVRYFLSNAGQWRGETARIIKAELKRRIA